jgi:hypothetical protein
MASKGGKKRALPWADTPEVIDLTGDAPMSSAPPASKSRKTTNVTPSSSSSYSDSFSSQNNGPFSSSMARGYPSYGSQSSAPPMDTVVFDDEFFDSDWDEGGDEMDANATQFFSNMSHFSCYATMHSE